MYSPMFPSLHQEWIQLTSYRPKSRNAEEEEPPAEGAPMDPHAEPEAFYLRVESTGQLAPDAIVQQSIKVLQQKIAAVIQDLTGDDGTGAAGHVAVGDEYEPQSPSGPGGGGGAGVGGYADGQGYNTPYDGGGHAGGASAWGGGTTPYGATPYGQGSGWS